MPLPNPPPQPKNKLLAALSSKSYRLLVPHLDPVTFSPGEMLYQPNLSIKYAYFPHKSTISMVNILSEGTMVEVGVVGSEGIVGTTLLSGDDISPHQTVVQIANGGMRMKAKAFKVEVKKNEEFNELVHRYLQALFTQVAQTAACNRIHSIDKRLARWMLMFQDRMESDTLHLTHELIAMMLGSRRAGVTVAAGILQTAGIIKYQYGKVLIKDREALEEASCECYGVIKGEYDRLLSRNGSKSIRG